MTHSNNPICWEKHKSTLPHTGPTLAAGVMQFMLLGILLLCATTSLQGGVGLHVWDCSRVSYY